MQILHEFSNICLKCSNKNTSAISFLVQAPLQKALAQEEAHNPLASPLALYSEAQPSTGRRTLPDLPPVAAFLKARASGTILSRSSEIVKEKINQLRNCQVSIADLVMNVKISKPPEEFRVQTSAATAGRQLQSEGRKISAGQSVKFVYVKGFPRVHAWDSQVQLDLRRLDLDRYAEIMIRLTSDLLEPFGVSEEILTAWIIKGAWYGPSPTDWYLKKRSSKLPIFQQLST